ncbi:hypothetical protein [Rhizobium leguminosarum]|uniref:hypothetical protein n=1 Tax=Rhizobium leguminosarum TaxID=384 RepID=UPI001FF01A1E|nr:hypothetical protein [Rhizobium leguminosarum]
MDRPDDRAIIGVDPDHRMQIKTTAAAGAHHRRILNGQDVTVRTTAGRAQRRFIDHRLRIDCSIAQKSAQADLSSPVAAELAHPHSLAGSRNKALQQERPPFSR